MPTAHDPRDLDLLAEQHGLVRNKRYTIVCSGCGTVGYPAGPADPSAPRSECFCVKCEIRRRAQ
jgi:hypothetical protein